MSPFTILVLQIDFEQSKFQKVGFAFAKFHLFQLSLFWVLGESSI